MQTEMRREVSGTDDSGNLETRSATETLRGIEEKQEAGNVCGGGAVSCDAMVRQSDKSMGAG